MRTFARRHWAALAAVLTVLCGAAYAANEIHYDRSILFRDSVATKWGNDGDVVAAWDGTDFDVTFAADDSVVNWGNGTNSPDIKTFGNIATAYSYWDASANELRHYGPVRVTDHTLSGRYGLRWTAGANGKPALNAVIATDENSNAAAHLARNVADREFEILGANASTDDVTIGVEGGIVIQTDGGGTDSVIVLPHLDTAQTAWSTVTWGTDKQTEWECDFATGADITACVIWAGLKLTNTSTTTTDAKQCFFRYAPATNSGEWQAIYSINNTDTETDSNVAVAASTRYHLKIAIDSSRIARMYINGALVNTSTALDNTTDLIPYIGVLESEAVAKDIAIFGQAISRVPQ